MASNDRSALVTLLEEQDLPAEAYAVKLDNPRASELSVDFCRLGQAPGHPPPRPLRSSPPCLGSLMRLSAKAREALPARAL